MNRQLKLFELREIRRELEELEELDEAELVWTDELERQAGGKWRDSDRLLDGEEVIWSPLLCGTDEGHGCTRCARGRS